MATPIHDAAQADYRLAQQCGADAMTAESVAVSYRLDSGSRPIERIGGGWAEFGLEAGTHLEDAAAVEGIRRVMTGRDPHSHRRLVKPKLAVHPKAKLSPQPLLDAVKAACLEREITPQELLADPWALKRAARLVRGMRRDGDHRAAVGDLERVAAAAGVDLEAVYTAAGQATELATAEEHREERVQVGVMGYDVTFDRPKGISVLQALADPEVAARMEALHLEAVRESVAALERWTAYGMAGHHGDGKSAERVATSGFLATMTVHRTARPVDDRAPGDPHLHTHVMIANMAKGADGRWRTVAAGGRDLMRHVPAVGELYRALEREKLTRELGLAFERDAATGRWDVVGIPPDLKSAFSRRQRQVRAAAGHGATPAQGRAAARATARAKTASTPESERESWHTRALEAGHRPRQVVDRALGREPGAPGAARRPPKPLPWEPSEVAAAVWDPETGVTAHTKVVTRAKVMAHIAGALRGGLADAAALEELTDHVLAHELAVALPAAGPVHMSHADRYTSVDIPAAERTILEAARGRRGAGAARVPVVRAAHALRSWQRQKGFALSAEQHRVVTRLIGDGHGIDAVLGVAGAGKTTIMSAARTAWETAGYRVEGAAVAAVAAAGLRAEAGITSRTVASWRRRIEDGPGLDGVHVLVLDEAAMVGDRNLALLTREAGRTGTKLVLVGDPLQLRSVAAGGSFTRVHEAVDGLTLSENRRQRREVDQAALATWRTGARRSALALWGEHGLVHATADAATAHDRMAAAWWKDRQAYLDSDGHDAVERLLMVATTNRDVGELNERARAAARAGGLLQGPEVSFPTAAGERLALAAGDQVRVRANDYRSRSSDDPDVLNGFRGLVREVDPERGALVQWRREDHLEQAWIGPEALKRGDLSHGYAITIAAAQGVTVDRCHVYGLGADAHGLYAGMSRAKERTDLYLPALEVEKEEVRRRLGEARTDAERCVRVISAYADTLTADPPGLVLDELEKAAPPLREVVPARPEPEREPVRQAERAPAEQAATPQAREAEHGQDQEHEKVRGAERGADREDLDLTPWRPLSEADARAGRGPAARAVAEEVAAARQRAQELKQALPDLQVRVSQAREYAQQGTLRLLMDGTTPKAAREQAAERQQEFGQARNGIVEAEHQAKTLWQRARETDFRQALKDAERHREEERAEHERRHAEMLGTAYALTREEIGALERKDRDQLVRRHAIEATAIGYRSEPDTRIEMTPAEQRQLAWEELPEEVRAERTAEKELIAEAQAQAEHARQPQNSHQAPEHRGPTRGL
ncbi:MobF family relaxase [Nocardiopsis flavescens]|nr:MobF family relaxase [Nocardiopsis flavescens]